MSPGTFRLTSSWNQAEVDAARAALTGVPAGPVRTALQAVADQVLDRQV